MAGSIAGFIMAAARLGRDPKVRDVLGRVLLLPAGFAGAIVGLDGATVLLLLAGREALGKPPVMLGEGIILDLIGLALMIARVIAGLLVGVTGGTLAGRRGPSDPPSILTFALRRA